MVSATVGRLARTLSCCATRTSLTRVEIAIPSQTDHPAINGVNITWTRTSGPRMIADDTPGWANSATTATNTPNTR